MKRKKLTETNVTVESVFMFRRRQVLKMLGISVTALSLSTATQTGLLNRLKESDHPPAPAGKALDFTKSTEWQANLTLTPEGKVAGYDNSCKFGFDRIDPVTNASSLRTDPWTLTIGNEVVKPLAPDHDDLTKRFPLKERIYHMRRMEAWSIVVPWTDLPLYKLLVLVEPISNARHVTSKALYVPGQIPGQKDRFIGGGFAYPYVEELQLGEAIHPLTLLTVGMYGKTLPSQNGAPARLTVSWGYGFKGIELIADIELTRKQSPTIWNLAAPDEYSLFTNVNPYIGHPR